MVFLRMNVMKPFPTGEPCDLPSAPKEANMFRPNAAAQLRRRDAARSIPCDDAPGIVIQDGGRGLQAMRTPPRVRAFVYGEKVPSVPTLPFGRWKVAS